MKISKPQLIIILLLSVLTLISCSKAPENVAVSVDGVQIRYDVQGEGEPALVFVHGWCCDRSYWDAQVPHFAQKYKVVTIDLAGHGESGLSRKAYTMSTFGQDVAAVVNKLDLDQIVLIGHSMGGPVILEAARTIPENIKGLVGVDTFGRIKPRTQEWIDNFMAPFHANFAERTAIFVRQNMFTPNSDPALIEKIVSDMSAAPAEVGSSAIEEILKHDLIPALREVNAPIRCINKGRNSTNVETIRQYAPTFDVIAMSNVGHFVMMEDPETFNRMLDKIVKEYIR